jgi:hypothetical protein
VSEVPIDLTAAKFFRNFQICLFSPHRHHQDPFRMVRSKRLYVDRLYLYVENDSESYACELLICLFTQSMKLLVAENGREKPNLLFFGF